jgi:hypothetical protein
VIEETLQWFSYPCDTESALIKTYEPEKATARKMLYYQEEEEEEEEVGRCSSCIRRKGRRRRRSGKM